MKVHDQGVTIQDPQLRVHSQESRLALVILPNSSPHSRRNHAEPQPPPVYIRRSALYSRRSFPVPLPLAGRIPLYSPPGKPQPFPNVFPPFPLRTPAVLERQSAAHRLAPGVPPPSPFRSISVPPPDSLTSSAPPSALSPYPQRTSFVSSLLACSILLPFRLRSSSVSRP